MKIEELKGTSEYLYSLAMFGNWNGINSSTGQDDFAEDMDSLVRLSGIGYYDILNALEGDYELKD